MKKTFIKKTITILIKMRNRNICYTMKYFNAYLFIKIY